MDSETNYYESKSFNRGIKTNTPLEREEKKNGFTTLIFIKSFSFLDDSHLILHGLMSIVVALH